MYGVKVEYSVFSGFAPSLFREELTGKKGLLNEQWIIG